MRKLIALLSRVRLKYRSSSTMTKTVVMSAIVVCMLALLTLQIANTAKEKRLEADRQRAAQLEQEQNKLNDNIDKLGSAESVKDIAREELDLEDPDSILVFIEEMEETN